MYWYRYLNNGNISDSPSSSRLYEFGYVYDHDNNQPSKKQSSTNNPDALNKDHRTATSALKTSPVNHYDRNKNPRGGENNSLTRKHHEMNRKISKDKNR